jgi:hypothetical protein
VKRRPDSTLLILMILPMFPLTENALRKIKHALWRGADPGLFKLG